MVFFYQLGGTIGDIEGMPFVEAFRQFQFTVGSENFCNIHVSLVPQVRISVTNENVSVREKNVILMMNRGTELILQNIYCFE